MRNKKLEDRMKKVDTRLNLVLHNGKFRLYDTQGDAYYAAQQLGGDAIPITSYIHYYDFTEITVEEAKKNKSWRKKYNQK
jgi:hypothetical protein